jgi:hypothetical protein
MNFTTKWDRKDIINSIPEFSELYARRPIDNNEGGMKSAHMLASWYIVKTMKPKYIIESGVWKGLGTWLFENASPTTKIVSIDPAPQFREYTSPNAHYTTTDFLDADWSAFPKDETLLFFDDHQNFLTRLQKAHEIGFKYVIDEDNYPSNQGDCYSPKKVLANQRYVMDSQGNRSWHDILQTDLEFLQNNVSVYQEMPPIYKTETTRWGDKWTNENYPTPKPLLDIKDSAYPLFAKEAKDYTWLCYIELKQ